MHVLSTLSSQVAVWLPPFAVLLAVPLLPGTRASKRSALMLGALVLALVAAAQWIFSPLAIASMSAPPSGSSLMSPLAIAWGPFDLLSGFFSGRDPTGVPLTQEGTLGVHSLVADRLIRSLTVFLAFLAPWFCKRHAVPRLPILLMLGLAAALFSVIAGHLLFARAGEPLIMAWRSIVIALPAALLLIATVLRNRTPGAEVSDCRETLTFPRRRQLDFPIHS